MANGTPASTDLGYDVPANQTDQPAQPVQSDTLGFDVPPPAGGVGQVFGGRIGGDTSYEPFYSAEMRRPSNMWGKPNLALQGAKNYPGPLPGPFHPQPQDFSNIRMQSGMALGQWGSQPVGMGAVSMLQFGDKAAKEFAQGQLDRARLDNLNYELANKKLIDRQVQESEAYGEAYTIFGQHNDPQRLKDELTRLTYAFDDPAMRLALHNSGFAAAHALQQYRDQHLMPLLQVEEQRAKIADAQLKAAGGAKEQALEEPFREPGATTAAQPTTDQTTPAAPGAAAAGAPTQPDGTQTPAQQAVPAPDTWQPSAAPSTAPSPQLPGTPNAPADVPDSRAPQEPNEPLIGLPQEGAAQPVQPAGPAGVQVASADPNFIPQAIREAEAGAPAPAAPAAAPTHFTDWNATIQRSLDAAATRGFKNGALLRDDAERLLLGDPTIRPQTVGTGPFGIIQGIASQMHQGISDILARNYSSDEATRRAQVLRDVAPISQTLAQWIPGLIDGTLTPASGWAKGRPPWNLVYGLAHKIEPNMDENMFRTRGATLRSFASGADGRNVTALGTTYLHSQGFLADLHKLQQFEAQGGGTAQEWLGTYKSTAGWSQTTPEQRALFQSLDQEASIVADEFAKAVHGTGTVEGKKTEAAILGWRTRDVGGLISMIENTMYPELRDRMEELNVRFSAGTGKSPDSMEKMFQIYETQGKVMSGTAGAIRDLTTPPGRRPLITVHPTRRNNHIYVTPEDLQ